MPAQEQQLDTVLVTGSRNQFAKPHSFIETMNYGRLAVLNAAGQILTGMGAIDIPISPRSALKPIFAVAMLRKLGAAASKIDERWLALACGSHVGDFYHSSAALDFLAAFEMDDSKLQCGNGGPSKNPITHCCSGKHGLMLATCATCGWDTTNYLNLDHELQQLLLETVVEFTGERHEPLDADGCGVPIFPVSPAGLARAYHRLMTAPEGTHEWRVIQAMQNYPEYVHGKGQYGTELMQGLPGRVIAKWGANGTEILCCNDMVIVAFESGGNNTAALKAVTSAALELNILMAGQLPQKAIDVLKKYASEDVLSGHQQRRVGTVSGEPVRQDIRAAFKRITPIGAVASEPTSSPRTVDASSIGK